MPHISLLWNLTAKKWTFIEISCGIHAAETDILEHVCYSHSLPEAIFARVMLPRDLKHIFFS